MLNVMFVDDDQSVLDDLRRSLCHLESEWNMVFVPHAAGALDTLEWIAVDVIVTDARMPDMSGAQLLEQVVRRYPDTGRITLTWDLEAEDIKRLRELSHIVLQKPCGANMLADAVRRSVKQRTKTASAAAA